MNKNTYEVGTDNRAEQKKNKQIIFNMTSGYLLRPSQNDVLQPRQHIELGLTQQLQGIPLLMWQHADINMGSIS